LGTIRVSINLGIGKVEIEGSTIEEVLDYLKNLPMAVSDLSDKINRVQQTIPKPRMPKGVKVTNLIRSLKKKGWFEKPQDVENTMKILGKMGFPANRRMVTSALLWLVRKGELNRKEEENRMVYFTPPMVVKL